MAATRSKTLIFIVAYKAAPYIAGVLERIFKTAPQISESDISILLIDDSSPDDTVAVACKTLQSSPLPWEVLCTPHNRGYGGNQKLGYSYAIKEGFDYVALVHGDGQYAPELLPSLLKPLITNGADGVLGSRMIHKAEALKGGMPRHKFYGNITLTWIQNHLLHTNLAEFHTGLRAWRVASLAKLPFVHNSEGFSFDTQIIIQMLDQKQRLTEIPIPTYYGDEYSHVNTVYYSGQVIAATLLSRLQRWPWARRSYFTYQPAPQNPDPNQLAMLEQMRKISKESRP